MKHALICFAIALPVFAAEPKPTAVESHTQRLDFPEGGTLRLADSFGEVTIDGWDQPRVELVITELNYAGGGEAALLKRVQISTRTDGKTVVIGTTRPHRSFSHPLRNIEDIDIEYGLKVPRAAKLEIDQAEGEINITGVTGDIRADSRYGPIVVRLPEGGHYAVDANAKLGSVYSDFAGSDRRKHLMGESFLSPESSSPQKLDLKTGMGDIMVLKINQR